MEELTSIRARIRGLWFLLILVASFVMGKVLGDVSTTRLLLLLGAIVTVSIAAIFIGITFSRDLLGIADREERLQNGLEELQKHQMHLVSNQFLLISDEMLRGIENGATKIRIISPDLHDDESTFYETILANVKAGKSYDYVIPDRPDLKAKMDRLLDHLRRDAQLSSPQQLPVRYESWSSSPIITEYVIYDSPKYEGLRGFAEIRTGPDPSDNTNFPLTLDDTHQLNHWFDEMFQ